MIREAAQALVGMTALSLLPIAILVFVSGAHDRLPTKISLGLVGLLACHACLQ